MKLRNISVTMHSLSQKCDWAIARTSFGYEIGNLPSEGLAST